jgi:hypothetical protein
MPLIRGVMDIIPITDFRKQFLLPRPGRSLHIDKI